LSSLAAIADARRRYPMPVAGGWAHNPGGNRAAGSRIKVKISFDLKE